MEPSLSVLPREFYQRETVEVARSLLGMLLVSEGQSCATIGRVVEVEAYLGSDDPASHAFRGLTPRNRSMFGPAGHAYVYAIHAKYCFNVVTETSGHAVLIRSLEPLSGLDTMRRRRDRERPLEIARGPARLCQALAIGPHRDGWDLTRGEQLWLAEAPPVADAEIIAGPRVGIRVAADLPLRYSVKDNRFVSLPKPRPGEAQDSRVQP